MIYIVTRDEEICGVFTNIVSATRMAEAIGGQCAEYELNPELNYEVARGYNFYRICLYREGTLYGEIECIDYRDTKSGYWIDKFFGHSDTGLWKLKVLVWAKTPQEALDYANSKRKELISAGEWERTDYRQDGGKFARSLV